MRGGFYGKTNSRDVVLVTYTPEECVDAYWAKYMRIVQDKPDAYPDVLLEAIKLCQTTPEETRWCTETLHPIYNEFRSLEVRREDHIAQLDHYETAYN